MIDERNALIDKITELLLYYLNSKKDREKVSIEILLVNEILIINYYKDKELLDNVEIILYDKELFNYCILGIVNNILGSFRLEYDIINSNLFDRNNYINIKCLDEDTLCLLITLVEYMKRNMNSDIFELFKENCNTDIRLQPNYINILEYQINLSKILIRNNCKNNLNSLERRFYE